MLCKGDGEWERRAKIGVEANSSGGGDGIWITEGPSATGPTTGVVRLHAGYTVATLRITGRYVFQFGYSTFSYHFPHPISLCSDGSKPLTNLLQTFDILPTIILKLSQGCQ